MASALSSKQEKPESSLWFDYFLLCLTKFSQREVIVARRLALKCYGMDGKPRKESPKRKG